MIVSQFSCGAASAVATKIVLNQYALTCDVKVINAYLKEEHPDNRRFLEDCEEWFGTRVVRLCDEKYGGSAREVFRRKRYTKGRHGAPCSRALKRDVLDAFMLPTDVRVLGFTYEEQWRYDLWIDANNEKRAIVPLIDNKLGKADVLAMIERAGLVLPLMYRLGYHNANCIGCVKGGGRLLEQNSPRLPRGFRRDGPDRRIDRSRRPPAAPSQRAIEGPAVLPARTPPRCGAVSGRTVD